MQKMEIIVKGVIDQSWSEWFDGFEVTHAPGRSILEGAVRDQAELRGILSRIADLHLELISVNTISGRRIPKEQVKGGDSDTIKTIYDPDKTKPEK